MSVGSELLEQLTKLIGEEAVGKLTQKFGEDGLEKALEKVGQEGVTNIAKQFGEKGFEEMVDKTISDAAKRSTAQVIGDMARSGVKTTVDGAKTGLGKAWGGPDAKFKLLRRGAVVATGVGLVDGLDPTGITPNLTAKTLEIVPGTIKKVGDGWNAVGEQYTADTTAAAKAVADEQARLHPPTDYGKAIGDFMGKYGSSVGALAGVALAVVGLFTGGMALPIVGGLLAVGSLLAPGIASSMQQNSDPAAGRTTVASAKTPGSGDSPVVTPGGLPQKTQQRGSGVNT